MINLDVTHNSFDKFYRNPFGAVEVGKDIIIKIRVNSPIVPEQVSLFIEDDHSSADYKLNMSRVFDEKKLKGEAVKGAIAPIRKEEFEFDSRHDNHIYQVKLNAGNKPRLLFYHFSLKVDGKTYYYGKKQNGFGGVGRLSEQLNNKYQITIYKDTKEHPLWFSESIVYQIFVDRFFNGNPDKKVINPKKNSLIHSHWDNDPVYIKDEDGRVIRWDFFGGNLLGVREKLSYLKDLGISVIYFNPIFQAASNHKYDTGNYHKIDEMFGNNKLFARLVKEAEEMGISIILDGVFSHTGNDSIYFNKYDNYDSEGAYQSKDSPYFNWYNFSNYPDEYESWWGITDLPNVNELEESYQNFIIYDEESVLNHWMNQGIKGWRLDVADELPEKFIKNFKKEMIRNTSDSVLIGEVWEDASNKSSYDKRREYFLGEELDSVTSYPFRNTLIDFIMGKIDSKTVHKRLMTLAENYPLVNFYSVLNLLGTHDVPRILTEISRDHKNDLEAKKYWKQVAVKRLKILSLWQMTFPGVPCIYYGDEAGLEGEADPDNRRTYPWGQENQEILNWYKDIIRLRNKYDIFKTGEWYSLYYNQDVYGFIREIKGKDVFGRDKDSNCALVLFNRSLDQSYEIETNLEKWFKGTNIYDYFDRGKIAVNTEKIKIDPLDSKIYINIV